MEQITALQAGFDFDGFFETHYVRIARVIARVVRDPARAEELAVDCFWKLWRNPGAHGDGAGAWIYRAAVRTGLDELRRHARRDRYEWLLGTFSPARTPEQLHAVDEERDQVRRVLARLKAREAEMLLLRGEGLSYHEIASTLGVNVASIGTLLARAQQAFRKEYVRSYGKPRQER